MADNHGRVTCTHSYLAQQQDGRYTCAECFRTFALILLHETENPIYPNFKIPIKE